MNGQSSLFSITFASELGGIHEASIRELLHFASMTEPGFIHVIKISIMIWALIQATILHPHVRDAGNIFRKL
ncbi:MAG: hypothetical protein HQM13_23300 [SAR324 cluster bacterium]|nr:hypothetical protein [SAR324 cluster bacterium]